MTAINNTTFVTIDPAPAGPAWRCEEVQHLPGEQNLGKHNIFIEINRDGSIVRDGNIKIIWGWEGQHSDEIAPPAICNKQDPTYSADIPIDKYQHIWLKIDDGKGTPSDVVRNLHADLPADGEGNSQWHHSYFARFVNSVGSPGVVQLMSTEQQLADHERRLRIVERLVGAK